MSLLPFCKLGRHTWIIFFKHSIKAWGLPMARSILSSVGAGGVNRKDDSITIQELLNKVPQSEGGPIPALNVDGLPWQKTIAAIKNFQRKQLRVSMPDGRVDPNGPTLAKLNQFDGPPKPPGQQDFPGCSTQQSATIRSDLARAKQMLDVTLNRLRTTTIKPEGVELDTKQKVKRIFHIDMLSTINPNTITEAFNYTDLLTKFATLRASLDKPFPIKCEATGLFGAWVSPNVNDETVHFTPLHFQQGDPDQRAVEIIHERAHTVLNLPGNPHPGIDAIIIGMAPDDDIGLSQGDAIRNAYCYEWLALSLQSNYDANKFRNRITTRN